MKYTYIKDYKNDDKHRRSLNALTQKTYGFNFEEWYANGFWGGEYIPHSLVDGEKMIANVSVNLMDFHMDGIEKHYIQIGTVMTDEAYRGQGLSRYLMEKVIRAYQEKVDGIYLFGNDSVVNLYPKFGFVKSKEYYYTKRISSTNHVKKVEHLDVSNQANWESFLSAVKSNVGNERLSVNNFGLMAFWTMGSESIYYLKEEEAYIIAQVKGERLCINQIIANHRVDLETIINAFGNEIKRVELGFTPYETVGYELKEWQEEDCTLFILGKDLKQIEEKKLMFPLLSHA